MGRYLAIPRASNIPVVVATGTAVKSVLQVLTPSTTDIRVVAWGVSFAGIVATNPAGICTLTDIDVAATSGTSITPEEMGSDYQTSSLCVGGTGATGYNFATEGTLGATTRLLDSQLVHPQAAYSIWFPEPGPRVPVSRSLRIRCTFSVDVNCIPWIIFDEPS